MISNCITCAIQFHVHPLNPPQPAESAFKRKWNLAFITVSYCDLTLNGSLNLLENLRMSCVNFLLLPLKLILAVLGCTYNKCTVWCVYCATTSSGVVQTCTASFNCDFRLCIVPTHTCYLRVIQCATYRHGIHLFPLCICAMCTVLCAGGLLVCLPKENATAFCEDIEVTNSCKFIHFIPFFTQEM